MVNIKLNGISSPTYLRILSPLPMQLFARAEYCVCLYDISDEQLQGAKVAIQRQLEELEGQGLLREGQTAAQLLRRVNFSSDLKDAVDGAEYVQVEFC